MRFPEFTNEWEKNYLSKYLVVSSLKNKNDSFTRNDVLSVSGDLGCVNQIQLLGRSFAGASLIPYHVVELNDIVYTKSPLAEYPYGIIKTNRYKIGIVSTLYAVYKTTNHADNKFIEHYFGLKSRINNYLKPIVRIGAKHDMKIGNSEVLNNYVIFPNVPEQKKIAIFIDLIDQRIDTQSKIIKKIKSLKKIICCIFKIFIEVLLLVPSRPLKIIVNILKLIMTIVKEVKNMVKRKNFYEVSNLWKEDKRHYIKKSSYSAYLLLLENHLLPYFGKKTEIVEKDVQQFVLSKLNDGLSQQSIKDMIIVLKMIVKFGVKQKLFGYSEIDIKFPSENEKADLEVLTKQDHRKILDYLENHFTFKNLGIYICLSTGMRIGEVCGLRWSDIDCEKGIIKVRRTVQRIYVITENDRHTEILIDTPKTKNSIRDIPMTSDLLKIMKSVRKVLNEEFYVITNEEKPTEPRTYRNYYKRLLKRLQINDLKFHGLRHSFATRCIESKCDYKTVSVILGHSNISTTLNLYVHPNLEQKKRCVNQMFRSLR